MTYHWHFNKHRSGDPMDDPIQGEYFSDESISNPGDSLVREGIQNSLDACRNGGRTLVRIRVSGANPLDRQVSPFFEGLWDHLSAKRNGLRKVPDKEVSCPYLLFEDFETTGLTGDPMLDWSCERTKNHFFHFFRAAGRSDKSDKDRGCWGVGKTVFPRSSSINAWFGLTVPEDRRRPLLMGRIVLKHHEVGGHRYTPNGFFGEPPADGNGIVGPVEDSDFINGFINAFDIQRGLDEPGLSVVVPWYESEDLTDTNIIHSVLRHCFWPILRGQLEVWIETPTTQQILKKENLVHEIGKLKLEDELLATVGPLTELASRAIEGQLTRFELSVPVPRYSYKWDDVPRDEERLNVIREKLDQREPIAIRVPFTIRSQNDQTETSHFDVYLRRENEQWKNPPIFIRSDITIPDVKVKATPGISSLVVIEDEPLATALRHAENPSHRQWQKDAKQEDGLRFKDRYKYAESIITFITGCPRGVMSLLSSLDTKPDRNLLADLFSIPAPPEEQESRTREKKKPEDKGTEPEKPTPPELPPRPRPFVIDRIEDGFVVRNGNMDGAPLPGALLIRAAYHVRRGNPFKKYHPADFDFSQRMKTQFKGVTVIEKKENWLRVKIDSIDFRIEVVGFDPKRDVRVEVKQQEDDNAEG